MKMLLADGHKSIEVGVPGPYEMQMSGGANQSIWQLSGLPDTQPKHDLIMRLMHAAASQGEKIGDPREFTLLRLMQLAYHMEWMLGMLGSPEKHRVCLKEPQAYMDSFKALCRELAEVDTGPAAEALKQGLARAQQNEINGKAAFEAQEDLRDQQSGVDLRSSFGNHRPGQGYGGAPGSGWASSYSMGQPIKSSNS